MSYDMVMSCNTLYYIDITGATYLRKTIFFKVGWYDSIEVVGGRWVGAKAKTRGSAGIDES